MTAASSNPAHGMLSPRLALLGATPVLLALTVVACSACGASDSSAGGGAAQDDAVRSPDPRGEAREPSPRAAEEPRPVASPDTPSEPAEDVEQGPGEQGDDEVAVGSDEPVTVFYIGHSLQNWTVPEMVASFARASGIRHDWEAEIGNGAPLRWLWDHADTAEGANPHTTLPSRSFDALVMTEGIPLAEQVRWNDSHGYARRFLELARRGNPECRAYFYETWHSRDTPRWRQRLDSDRRVWEGIVDRVNDAQDGPDMLIIPAGRAMAALHDRVGAGEVPGIRSMDDVFADDVHLNDAGWYFVALVQFSTVFRRSPVGLPRRTVDRWGTPHDPPPADAVSVLQAIAWDAVRGDPRSGVR